MINATNVETGTLWRFSRAVMADYKVGDIDRPTLRLANVVAASSAFPPFLSPYLLRVGPSDFSRVSAKDKALLANISLTDGGVYDNLGLETVWKAYRKVLVSDAGVRGLQESGIRGVYAYGSANLSLNDYWNQSKIAIPKDDVRRVRDTYFSSKDGLLTMQLATRGPGFCMDEVCTHEWTLARELGLPITVHVGMGRLAGRFAMIKQLKRMNLLGSDTTYIHCCYFDDEEWQLVKDTGGKISIASQIENELQYPGQIKVTVIRETRCIEVAK